MTENKRFGFADGKKIVAITDNGEVLSSRKVGDLLISLFDENQRMTNKLNKLALEFLNHDMVTMGKATEKSEMSYYHFLQYRKEYGNPMELQL